METYIIKEAYPEMNSPFREIAIKSLNLLFVEIGDGGTGLQCENQENTQQINERCKKIANLIREIDELNK